jgi:glycosyltransferase involved in cell wall biosynthesis
VIGPDASPAPMVSVVMSCYNAERWLEIAIRSVLEQNFGDFEFLIVDDGSTDRTAEIIRECAVRDARIIFVSKPNTGLSDSLNVGVSRARGTWVARLDADDVAEPGRLQGQITWLRDRPDVVLLGSGASEIDEQGHARMSHCYPRDHATLLRNLERGQRFFAHSSAMIRRDAFQKVGGYRLGFRKAQDADLWFRLGEYGTVACLDACLVRVRTHSDQLSYSEEGWSQLDEGIAAATSHFLRRRGYPDPIDAAGGPAFTEFMTWISHRVERASVPEKRRLWLEARAAYTTSQGGWRGLGRFGIRLFRSRHAVPLLWERYFGSSLAEDLAVEWTKRGTGGSGSIPCGSP